MEPALDLGDFLNSVEAALQGSLTGEAMFAAANSDTLMTAARHLCMGGGGKRARPMMVRLFGDACGASSHHLVDIGVCAELIHSASLLHDDVIDAGMYRRGRATVNARWGNVVAVMTGDILLTTAMAKLMAIDHRIAEAAIATVAEMTRWAVVEVEARGDVALPLEKLRSIAEGKTGSLFGWCGLAAAILGGDSHAQRRFAAFGRRLGVAFQIADDIRDLTGLDQGKPPYADLQSRTPSLPILLAASRDEALGRRLKESWAFAAMTPDRVRELGTAILCTGVVDLAVDRMKVEIEAAIDALGPYIASPGGAELTSWARRLAVGIQARGAG